MMCRVFAVVGAAAFAAAVTAAAQEKAPDTYKVKFDTSKGPIVIEVHRTWAPLGTGCANVGDGAQAVNHAVAISQ